MKSVFTTLVLVTALFLITGLAISYKEADKLSSQYFRPGGGNLLYLFEIGIAMLVGIISGRLHSHFRSLKRQQSIKVIEELKSAFSSRDLYLSMFASPIVFGIVYNITIYSPDPIMTTILAFQNGFFCDVILSRHA